MAHLDSSSTSEPFPCPSFDVHHVFINSDDTVIQKTFASHIRRRLREHGLQVLFNLEGEDKLTSEKERQIREAPVHLAVFSPDYAGSSWCLNELMFRLGSMKDPESDSTIIPVFYRVKPSQLRWTKKDDGVYAESLRSFQKKETFDSKTIEQWREALSEVAGKSGFELDAFNGDEGKLVDQIIKRVLKKLQNHLYYDVFINHRGPDVKKSFASHLYHRLLAHGLRVFLDTEELQKGDTITSQIKRAIQTASIHVAIFSPGYAASRWCLDELVLMLESCSIVVPVFYHVYPSELTRKKGVYAKALHILEKKKTFDDKPRYDPVTIYSWRYALSAAGDISGFDIEACNGDEGLLVQKVVGRVLTLIAERYPTGL